MVVIFVSSNHTSRIILFLSITFDRQLVLGLQSVFSMAAAHCERTGIPPLGSLARAASLPLHRQSSLDAFRRRVSPLKIESPATADEPETRAPLNPWDINYDEIFPQCARLAEQFRNVSVHQHRTNERHARSQSELPIAVPPPHHQSRFEETAVRLTSSPPSHAESTSSRARNFRELRSRVLGCSLGSPCTVSLANSRQREEGSRSQDGGRFEAHPEEAGLRDWCWARQGKSNSLGGEISVTEPCYDVSDVYDNGADCICAPKQLDFSCPRYLSKQASEPRMSGPTFNHYDRSSGFGEVRERRAKSFALDRLPVASICDAYLGLDDLDDAAFSDDDACLFTDEMLLASEIGTFREEVTNQGEITEVNAEVLPGN
ncbi:unnamed protein product [Closterium sp. Yama58-4]|nr:unnamed protein product [Closterium sp. Yama58-4]